MHRILIQARFAGQVSDALEKAYEDGKILENDRYLTSDEAGAVYDYCDDGLSVEDAVEELMQPRLDRFIAEMRRLHGHWSVIADTSDESYREAMIDAGRGHLLP